MGASDFLPPAKFNRRKPPFYVDYGRQLEIALILSRVACEKRDVQFLSAFGFAGTGKSSLGLPLWWQLNSEGRRVSLLPIDCLKLHSGDPERAIAALRQMMDGCLAEEANYPLIVALDEIEAIAPKRRTDLTLWTMQLLKSFRTRESAAIVIGSSNYPDTLDITINSELGPCIYFPEATSDLLIKIAKKNGMKKPEEFAQCYQEKCGLRFVPLPRPYVEGLRYLGNVVSHVSVAWDKSATIEERVELAQSMSPPAPRLEYDEYEQRLRAWIERASKLKSVLLA